MQTQTKPKVYTYEHDFEDFTRELDKREPLLIDEEMFYYWLEVLPPVYMHQVQEVEIDGVKFQKKCAFGFAEGWENIIDFGDPVNGGIDRRRTSMKVNFGIVVSPFVISVPPFFQTRRHGMPAGRAVKWKLNFRCSKSSG